MKYAQVPGYEGAPLYASDQLALAFLNPVLFHLWYAAEIIVKFTGTEIAGCASLI